MEYNQLKASIAAVIKTNNRKEITGQLLQNVLFQMTNVIGENLQLAGFATPLTDPHEPDQNVFYVTDQGGVYPHFDNLTVDDGLTFLMWKNGEWTSHTVGVVTQEWVDSHYVSIDFFRSLFRAYDSAGLEILPNNNPEEALPTVVDNIKAMVGFWTEQYISALGQQTGGGGGGGATSLDELSDVFLTNPSLGQALVFTITPDHPEGIWVNQTIQAGTDMATVWAALAGNTTQQINISHLTDALADYATKTYVDQNFITVAYFDRLFRAYNGNTLVSHNDVTSTIDNIKAMFGFWTEQYLSSLGNNSGGGGQLLALSNMADVTLTTPIADKQVLTFDAVSGKWINSNATGASSLSTLTDVTLTSLQANQVLVYNGSAWVNSGVKTINGNSIFGTGDIPASGGGTGNYLPLAGGTMTGSIINGGPGSLIKSASGHALLSITDNYAILGYDNVRYQKTTYVDGYIARIRYGYDWGYFTLFNSDGKIGIDTTNLTHKLNIESGVSGGLSINTSTQSSIILKINNNYRAQLGYSEDEIIFWNYAANTGMFIKDSGKVGIRNESPYTTLHINSVGSNDGITIEASAQPYLILRSNNNYKAQFGYSVSDNEVIIYNYAANTGVFIKDSGNVGIGTNSVSYKLHVAGTIYATGAITALSDARKKDITGEADVSVEQIAHAPAVQFLWKDKERRKDGHQVGTLAQYWQTVLPEVVSDKGGELSMQYGVAALVSAIVTARKVVDHERRITELEKENKRLRMEVEQLRLN